MWLHNPCRRSGAGARSAVNPHAACDAAGTGNGITVALYTGHAGGNSGHGQGVGYGLPRQFPALPRSKPLAVGRWACIGTPAVFRQNPIRAAIVHVRSTGEHPTEDACGHSDGRRSPASRVRAEGPAPRAFRPAPSAGVLARSAPRFRASHRLLWVGLRRWWPRWREALVLVQPATVARLASLRASSMLAPTRWAQAGKTAYQGRTPRPHSTHGHGEPSLGGRREFTASC